MRLAHIEITHLRSIETLTLNLRDYTTLIGANNSGKSTILRAVELLLGNKKPALEDWRNNEFDTPIEIIGRFTDLSDDEKSVAGTAGIVENGEILLKYSASTKLEANGTRKAEAPVYTAWITDEDLESAGFSDTFGKLTGAAKDFADNLGITKPAQHKERKEEIKQAIRDAGLASRTTEWSSKSISFPNALQQSLPKPILVPAVRDACDEAGTAKSSAFGELFSAILAPALQATPEYGAFVQASESLSSVLKGATGLGAIVDLKNSLSTRISDLIPAKALLRLAPPDIEKQLSSGVELRLDSGIETGIERQGNGLQRALIFALLEEIAKIPHENGHQRPVILLFEEPELFLHPHLMRKLRDVLKTIGARSNWQVVTSTHSPFLVDVAEDPTSLVLLRRNSPAEPVSKTQLLRDPFVTPALGNAKSQLEQDRERLRAALDFHPTVCEAFFASETVLVEGDTEVAILNNNPDLWAAFGLLPEACRNVTIVSCGGKWTIPPMALLLKQLGVPFRVVHDRDQKNRTPEILAEAKPIDPFRANERIASTVGDQSRILVHEDNIESALGYGSGGGSKKPFVAWRWVRDLVSSGEASNNAGLKKLVLFAFASATTSEAGSPNSRTPEAAA